MTEIPHRIGEIGVAFRARFRDQGGAIVPLDTATTKEIRFESPKGVAKQLPATFPAGEDGTQGNIEALTIAGTLDEIGSWKWQGHAIGPGFEHYTDIANFEVKSNL